MSKIVVLLLILIASVGGGAYYIINQNKPAPLSSGTTQIVTKVTPIPSKAPLLTTDESIDSDLTVMEKDLAELQLSDADLTKDVNGL